jgi:glycosyltransferase involved in cell wall biosynthesis
MENQGRGSACNAGVAESRAAYITFLDVDCVPQEDFVANLTVEIARGAPLIFGHIRFASGDAFFDRYENSVQLRRRSAMDSWATSLTSANVTLRRELVLAVGGFNNVYRHYGFEDRDLFLRLQRAFPDIHPVYSDACLVEHVDRPQLAVIESKFERSGRFTARRFRSDHADAYRRIPVSHFDARYSRILRSAPDWSLKSGVWALHPIVRWLFHLCHDREWDQLAAFALKVLKGLAFMRGTLSE